jgi:hypothetical protein
MAQHYSLSLDPALYGEYAYDARSTTGSNASTASAQDIMNNLSMSPTSAVQWAEALGTLDPGEVSNMISQVNKYQDDRKIFDELLLSQGLVTIPIDGDGNCLFRSVSFIIYGTDEHFALIRYFVCIYVRKFPSKCFQTSPSASVVQAYVDKMSKDKEWGDEIALRAISCLYERPVKVFITDGEGGVTVHPEFPGINASSAVSGAPKNEIILANFSGVSHFNAVEDSRTEYWRLQSSSVGRFEELRLA